jgi:spermidine/putrescine transport system permease protein
MTSRRRTNSSIPRWWACLAFPDLGLFVLAFCVPLAVTVAYSLGTVDYLTAKLDVTGTIDAYRELFSSLYRPVIARSFALAAITVALCVAIGTPAALALSRLAARRQGMIVALLVFPSFVSFTIRLFAWSQVIGKQGIVERTTGLSLLYTPAGVLLGMLAAYVPLFILPAYVALQRTPRSLLDASADLGATRWEQTRTVTLPLALPGIVTGALLVAVLAIGEAVVPKVLGGGKVLLLGNLLQDSGFGFEQPLGSAIAVLLLAVLVVAAVTGALVGRIRGARVAA